MRNERTSDILLWFNNDGMGTEFEDYSVSYWHNRLATSTLPKFNATQINGTGTPPDFLERQSSSYISLLKGEEDGEFYVT